MAGEECVVDGGGRSEREENNVLLVLTAFIYFEVNCGGGRLPHYDKRPARELHPDLNVVVVGDGEYNRKNVCE